MLFARFVIVAMLLAAGLSPVSAQMPASGGECGAMVAARGSAKGLWLGTIRGQRQDMWDNIEDRYLEACFSSKSACERWLYDQRSYFQLNIWNDRCQPLAGRR